MPRRSTNIMAPGALRGRGIQAPTEFFPKPVPKEPESTRRKSSRSRKAKSSRCGSSDSKNGGEATSDSREDPLTPELFDIRFTADRELRDLLRDAKRLTGLSLPELLELCVGAEVDRRMKARYGHTREEARAIVEKPPKAEAEEGETEGEIPGGEARVAPSEGEPGAGESGECEATGRRKPPVKGRRAVFERDGGRCTYRNARGERCRETLLLEYDHRDEVARGGPTTVDNLRLRCRLHNQWAARQTFGDAFIDEKIQKRRGARPEVQESGP